MQRLLIILSLYLLTMQNLFANDSESVEPDFAYPKTVEAEAAKTLADPATDGPTCLRALLELTAARCMVDHDSLAAMPPVVAAQLGRAGLTDADRAMLMLLEAELYRDIYRNYAGNFNRAVPEGEVPADPMLWNNELFYQRVTELTDSALTLARVAEVPLQRYAASLQYSKAALQYFPTVASFVEFKKVGFVRAFSLSVTSDADVEAAEQAALAACAPATAPAFYWLGALCRNDKARLIELYKQYADVEAARYLLAQACTAPNLRVVVGDDGGADDVNDMIAMLESSIDRFPGWYGNDKLISALNNLRRPTVTFYQASACAPGKPFDVTVKTHYADGVELTLYRLPDGTKIRNTKDVLKKGRRIMARTLSNLARDAENTLEFTAPEPGEYAMVGVLKGAKADPVVDYFECLPFIPLTINGLPECMVITADFTTGAPVVGVTVESVSRSWRKELKEKTRRLGTTSASGFLTYSAKGIAGNDDDGYNSSLNFRYKGRTYDFDDDMAVGKYWTRDDGGDEPSFFLDRPIYRPGETVQWAVVIARRDGRKVHVGADTDITVKLLNANYQLVDTVAGRTDASGRFSGSFTLPTNQLTGRYHLQAEWGNRCGGSQSFTVSDFKTPTIYTEITATERDVPSPGCVRLTGKVMTYSGMPVAGAQVVATVKGARRWRWFSPDRELGTVEATTDANGIYTLELDSAMLAQPFDDNKPFTSFIADITATAPDASTADVNASFTTGKPYVLAATTAQSVVDTSRPVAVTYAAYDASGENRPIEMRWQLRPSGGADTIVAQGTANGNTTVNLDLTALPAAVYTMTLEPVDSSLAEPVKDAITLTTYNVGRNDVPRTDDFVFVPQSQVKIVDGRAEVLVGCVDKQQVYTVLVDGESFRRTTVDAVEGFRSFAVELPDSARRAQLIVVAVKDGRVFSKDVELLPPTPPAPAIVAESFRDRLVPGTQENWRIRLANVAGTDAAAIVTIYNKALEQLQAMAWPGQIRVPYLWEPRAGLNWYQVDQTSRIIQAKMVYTSVSETVWPTFKYLDYMGSSGLRCLYGYAGSSPMPVANRRVKMMAADDMLVMNSATVTTEEESADEAVAEAATGADATTGAAEEAAPAFEYRLSEVLQALWAPTLTADAQGNIDICFTVPNANATWQLRATAWTPELESAAYAFECLANKPIMVQPNLPRFLRQGDRATVIATVFNNTAEPKSVTVTVDTSTGVSTTATVAVEPLASAQVPVVIDVPVDAAQIEYKVKAVADGYADGERALIPVLASESTVIESTEFYLNPGDSEPYAFTVDVPKGGVATLQYCQNPVWTLVKAMRDVNGTKATTSTSLAIKLFATLSGRHIMEANPEIGAVLKQWRGNPSEEALTSMLARNADLKQLLLDQTPWLQAAQSATTRMQALAQLTDYQAPLDATIAALSKLQNADGGFRWGSWGQQSSVWCTEEVLMHGALAYSLGMADRRDGTLRQMLERAFAYLEHQALDREKPATTYRTFTLIAALMPSLKPSAKGRALIDRTVDDLAKTWRAGSVVDKAYAILIFKANKRADEAAAVLESIRQFGVERPGMGMCFPSVNDMRAYATIVQAFAAMNAPRAEIDAMRQWVIVQAQASDDVAALNPDYLIAAMLSTGSVWTTIPVAQCVTVDGRPLPIDRLESASGYFAQRLDGAKGKTRITVTPNGVTPSYGSVVTIGRRSSATVKAQAGRDLSIAKRVLANRNGRWVETSDFVLGERLTVQLTIKAKRQLEYVSIDDCRPAAFEPVEQLPVYTGDGGLFYYRENLDASTRIFVGYMPAGTYVLSYEVTANNAGTFTTGIATLQSQYAPELTAHSSGTRITVK